MEERKNAPDGYKPEFIELSFRCGLDDSIVIPIDLRRQLSDIVHLDHGGITKMETEAKPFWWPDKKSYNKPKVKDSTACLTPGKNLYYPIPQKHYGKLEKTTGIGRERRIELT